VAYVRTVKTASGATAVQIVWSSRRGSRNIEHVGSAHEDAQVEALKAAAGQRILQGQGELDLGLNPAEIGSGPLEIIGSRAGYLWDALGLAYEALGFGRACRGDDVFRDLVLARIIEPTSKADSLRVLAETGIDTVTYHKRTHTASVVETGTDKVLATLQIDASLAGYRRLLRWASGFEQRRWAVENARGLGRHLAQWLVARDEVVDDHTSRRFSPQCQPKTVAFRWW
jgi:hypothetical protein